MGLEEKLREKLKPVIWADEQVLALHTKLAEYVEKRTGIDKNALSDRLSVTVAGAMAVYSLGNLSDELLLRLLSPSAKTPKEIDIVHRVIEVIVHSPRMAGVGSFLNILNLSFFERRFGYGTDSIAINPFPYYMKMVAKAVRFPAFISGLTGIGYSLYEAFALKGSFSDTVDFFVYGSLVALGASALYIKDSNPRLLKKEPFWKTAYRWIKERTSLPNLGPLPKPIPIQANSALDTYAQAASGKLCYHVFTLHSIDHL